MVFSGSPASRLLFIEWSAAWFTSQALSAPKQLQLPFGVSSFAVVVCPRRVLLALCGILKWVHLHMGGLPVIALVPFPCQLPMATHGARCDFALFSPGWHFIPLETCEKHPSLVALALAVGEAETQPLAKVCAGQAGQILSLLRGF